MENELHELPVGEYEITIERSKFLHRVLPTVGGRVPFFNGNGTFGRRDGCIILGEMKMCGLLIHSEPHFHRFNWRMRKQLKESHHKVIIQIMESKDYLKID